MQKSSSCSCICSVLGEALWCYACVGKGCSVRREECGSLLQNPVCATVDARKNFISINKKRLCHSIIVSNMLIYTLKQHDNIFISLPIATIYMKGCMSEYICRQQQQAPGTTAICCSSNYCNN